MNTLRQRLKAARDEAGLTQPELAARAGVAQSTIGNIEAGTRKRPRELLSIAAALGVNPEWLETGDGPMKSGVDIVAPASVRIPLLANGASMGPGSDELDGDVFIGALTVSERWVTREVRPSSPGALRFIHAYGESMAPTFADGDVLLVDTGARDPATIDGIYVLRAHGRLFVKRVRQRLDGQMEISSDNPTVKTVDVLNGNSPVEAMGRVIWAWNGRKL